MDSDSEYRPQSPDLGLRPRSPDLSGLPLPPFGGAFQPHQHRGLHQGATGSGIFGGQLSHQVTSAPQHSAKDQRGHQAAMGYGQRVKDEDHDNNDGDDDDDDDDRLPNARASKRTRKTPQSLHSLVSNGSFNERQSQLTAPLSVMKMEAADPTRGVQLKTSFPVARIKRLMQADEDIGKVAQVTPHVVSRALELFMIKLISASAAQAYEGAGHGSRGSKRIQPQHLKKAIMAEADKKLDFLVDIAKKIPVPPSKAKKEAGSESEDAKPGKRRKKRKESDDDL